MGLAGENQGGVICLVWSVSLQGTLWLLINTVQLRNKQMPQLLTDAHSLSPAPHLPILPGPPMLAHLQPISKATAVTQASIKNRDRLGSHQQAPEKGHQSQIPHASASAVCVSTSTNPLLTFALAQSIFLLSHRLSTCKAHCRSLLTHPQPSAASGWTGSTVTF